jgi:hypothetical protein
MISSKLTGQTLKWNDLTPMKQGQQKFHWAGGAGRLTQTVTDRLIQVNCGSRSNYYDGNH